MSQRRSSEAGGGTAAGQILLASLLELRLPGEGGLHIRF